MTELFITLAIAYISIQITRGRLPLAIMARIRSLFGEPNEDLSLRNELAHFINSIYYVSLVVALVACYLMGYPYWHSLAYAMLAVLINRQA